MLNDGNACKIYKNHEQAAFIAYLRFTKLVTKKIESKRMYIFGILQYNKYIPANGANIEAVYRHLS